MTTSVGRKPGRPWATSSAETRQRILDVAREHFADLGYGVTTNKQVAVAAGVTSGSIYHYFDSKTDMYLAVYSQVQAIVDDRFAAAMATSSTFVGQLEAVLEASYGLNADDPSLARFLGSARIDLDRHAELGAYVDAHGRRSMGIVSPLIETGLRTGEIVPALRDEVSFFVRTILTGLIHAVSSDLRAQRKAISAVEALLEGRLLKAPATPLVLPGRPRATL